MGEFTGTVGKAGPIATDREDRERAGRVFPLQGLPECGASTSRQSHRQFLHRRIVPDQHQGLRHSAVAADDVHEAIAIAEIVKIENGMGNGRRAKCGGDDLPGLSRAPRGR